MAISIPSDLVLDVVNAADPVAQYQATMKLGTSSGSTQVASASIPGFGTTDETFSDAFSSMTRPAVLNNEGGGLSRYQMAPVKSSVGEKFESMLLHQFLETMLPRDSSAVFGEGTAGEIWRSMLAEQVGEQMAKSNAVGLASYLKLNEQSNPSNKG